MPISFTLSPSQLATQRKARAFASSYLTQTAALTRPHSTPLARFAALRPIAEAAVAHGLVKAGLPADVGGGGGSLLESALAIEEYYAVDASAPIAWLAAGLGLFPVITAGTPEQKESLLVPFLADEGAPLACLAFSEPEGSANYLTNPALTTAHIAGDFFVIRGQKQWASNAGGWDYRGADLMTVVCRVAPEGSTTAPPVASNVSIIAITRADIAANSPGAFRAEDTIETLGFSAVSGPLITFDGLKVPRKNLVGQVGDGGMLCEGAFTGSAAMVGAMACGIMRTAYESALEFCKTQTRGGEVPIIRHQSVADRLITMKTKLETSRLLTWKGCESFEESGGQQREACYMAKIYASECAVDVVRLAMDVVGVEALANRQPYAQLMKDALVLPLFDGGNVGMRRRELQRLYEKEEYEPRAMAFGA